MPVSMREDVSRRDGGNRAREVQRGRFLSNDVQAVGAELEGWEESSPGYPTDGRVRQLFAWAANYLQDLASPSPRSGGPPEGFVVNARPEGGRGRSRSKGRK